MSKKFDFTKELAALTSDEFTSSVPYHATVGEAADAAVFVRKQHKGDKKRGTPGLEDAGISLAIADEIDVLVEHVLGAQAVYRQKTDPKIDTTKLDRARYVIDEIGVTRAHDPARTGPAGDLSAKRAATTAMTTDLTRPRGVHALPRGLHGLPHRVHPVSRALHALPRGLHGLPHRVHALPRVVHTRDFARK